MSDLTTSLDATTAEAGTARPLLSALTRWWTPAANKAEMEPELGYESAQPWALGEHAGAAVRAESMY